MLIKQEVREIKGLLANDYSVSYIARQTKKSLTTIYRIKSLVGKNTNPLSDEIIPKELRKFRHLIQQKRSRGITNTQKLLSELQKQGYRGNYMQLYRHIKFITGKENRDKKLVKRYETKPGEQAQVDWGSFGKITINGRRERLYAFAYILGYSRMKYVEFTIRQNVQTLQNCHIHAFEKLGIPQFILYDNMKTVVLKRDRKNDLEPTYNKTFVNFAKHFGFRISLSHPYWPRDKGKVEAAIKTIRNNFMNGVRFGRDYSSVQELNKKVIYWLDSDLNRRIHRATGERPLIRFEEEKKYLQFPNMNRNYVTSVFSIRYSTKYGMVQYRNNSYSVPQEFSRKKLTVEVRSEYGEEILDIYYQSKIIATHKIVPGRNKWIQSEEHFKTNTESSGEKVRVKRRKKKEDYKILHTSYSRPISYYDRFLKA